MSESRIQRGIYPGLSKFGQILSMGDKSVALFKGTFLDFIDLRVSCFIRYPGCLN
jgi:hypothetical protein